MWTDGTAIADTGVDVHLYPVAARFISVGQWHEDPSLRNFVPVPEDMAFRPFPVSIFLGPGKPAHPSVILRRAVYELCMLDPRRRSDRSNKSPSGKLWRQRRNTLFSVNLVWFLADTIARQLVKHIRSWGCTSDGGCEGCTATGVKFGQGMATSRFDFTEEGLELREDHKWHLYTSHYNHVSSPGKKFRV
jgi:hypothetical protein